SLQCTSESGQPAASQPAAAPAHAAPSAAPAAGAGAAGADDKVLAAWNTIYGVLESPRCMNCHPSGDAPLQGDDSHPHAQFVTRGADGQGAVGMRCETCHQTANLDTPHLPPGAPHWHLPRPEMPLVFQGRSSGELCRQLRDPAKNG